MVEGEPTCEAPGAGSFARGVGATVEAPPVRFEVCGDFAGEPDSALPSCRVCGWLADDHVGPAAGVAALTRGRPATRRPVHRAS